MVLLHGCPCGLAVKGCGIHPFVTPSLNAQSGALSVFHVLQSAARSGAGNHRRLCGLVPINPTASLLIRRSLGLEALGEKVAVFC